MAEHIEGVHESYEAAEDCLRRYFGVPEETLQAASTLDERPDLGRLVGALDRFGATLHTGSATTAGVLRARYPREFGVDVHQLIARPGGIDELCEFLDTVLEKNVKRIGPGLTVRF